MRAGRIAVTFDLWQTLILDEPERDEVRSRMRYEGLHKALINLGVHLPLQDLKKGYEESASRLQAIWRRNEDIEMLEQIRIIMELASKPPIPIPTEPGAVESLEQAYVDSLFTFPPKLNPEALEVLQTIRGWGLKIGLISNTGRSPGAALRQLLENYGVLKFFDSTVFSNETGFRKPDRRIYEQAARGLGVELQEIVHIGDDPEADIWGAKQVGVRALLYEPETFDLTRWQPNSLFLVTRRDRRLPDSEINPDRRIGSLKDALNFIESLT